MTTPAPFLSVFALLCMLAIPCLGQQGSIVFNGVPYLYNSESERQLVESLIRQRQQIDRINAQNSYWRAPTPQEVAEMEREWKEKNPLLTSHRMPDFSKRRIRVDRTEELSQKVADLEMRLRQFEDERGVSSRTNVPKIKRPPKTQSSPRVPATAPKQMTREEYDAAFSASEAKAIALYPFAGDPNSAGAKRMLEIEAEWKARNDDRYYSHNKPLMIAQLVAREMRIAPKAEGSISANPK